MADRIYLGVIAVLVLLLAYMFIQPLPLENQQNAGGTVESIYELQYENDAQVTNIEDMSGVYRVTVEFVDYTGQNATQDVFVTKDSKLLTDRFLITDNYRSFLSGQKSFIECLRDRGVRILGQTNDTATLQQLSLLGTYSYKLFVSCDGPSEEQCKSLGVDRYPTTVYNNTGYGNIFAPIFYVNLTGCQLP